MSAHGAYPTNTPTLSEIALSSKMIKVMVATVVTVTLAADYCPPRSEGFTFAVMTSIINLSTSLSGTFGACQTEAGNRGNDTTDENGRSAQCRCQDRKSPRTHGFAVSPIL